MVLPIPQVLNLATCWGRGMLRFLDRSTLPQVDLALVALVLKRFQSPWNALPARRNSFSLILWVPPEPARSTDVSQRAAVGVQQLLLPAQNLGMSFWTVVFGLFWT